MNQNNSPELLSILFHAFTIKMAQEYSIFCNISSYDSYYDLPMIFYVFREVNSVPNQLMRIHLVVLRMPPEPHNISKNDEKKANPCQSMKSMPYEGKPLGFWHHLTFWLFELLKRMKSKLSINEKHAI